MRRVAWTNTGVLALLCAGMLCARLVPPGPAIHGPGLAGQMFAWDAQWYFDIAGRGYRWDPLVGAQWGHNQNIAFFPLFPLIERAVMVITGQVSPIIFILLGLGFGLWANFAFYRLARCLLPEPAANWAVAFFAFWPAICFLAMGYPTGLVNLCAVSCLWYYVAGRRWQAVLWCGLGTAAAPTLVFIALALCADMALGWLRGARHPLALAKIILLGGASAWGLIAFMAYQQYAFGNALAFIAAQDGYVAPVPLREHLQRLFDIGWYLQPLSYTRQVLFGALWHGGAATTAGRQAVNVGLQSSLNFVTVLLIILTLLAASRWLRPVIIPLSGWFVVLGYFWFTASSNLNLTSTLRLLFPVMPVFLVLGTWADRNTIFGFSLLVLMALLAVTEVALVGAGYGII